jgi:cobyrinic acid a,c-diamide synthase
MARPGHRDNSTLAAMPQIPPLGQRIAVARDDAFAFSYDSVTNGWRRQGANIEFFSPLADEAPPADADAIYLPGGYPELHGETLTGATRFMNGLRVAAGNGVAIFGECGGYMVLGQGLVDAAGRRHEMAGLLPVETSFATRKLHLGYRSVATAGETVLGPKGTLFKGHEFHYASILSEGNGSSLFIATNARGDDLGPAGLSIGSVAASFIHLIDRASP